MNKRYYIIYDKEVPVIGQATLRMSRWRSMPENTPEEKFLKYAMDNPELFGLKDGVTYDVIFIHQKERKSPATLSVMANETPSFSVEAAFFDFVRSR